MNLRERAALAALVIILIVLGVAAPRFYEMTNLRDLALNNLPVLITSMGMLLVLLIGRIDISVGSQFALCSMAVSFSPVMAVLAGGLAGAVNGFLCGWMGLPSIVVTLGTMVALRDAIRWSTQGAWIQLPTGFQWAGLSQEIGQILILLLALVLVFITGWALKNTGLLRFVYATGADEESARLAGIPVKSVQMLTFVAAGLFVGLAALLNALRFNEIQPSAGMGLELKAIAAVVVGGASIRGGRGTMLGTVIGVTLLGVIGAALTFLGISAYWEKAIQGVIILLAALAESLGERRAG